MDYEERQKLCNAVAVACSLQDLEYLQKLLPEAEDLVKYRDIRNGGGFLHTLMYAQYKNEEKNPIDFLNKLIKAYDLENNPSLKKQLFLQRNANGKFAADFTYIYQYLHPESKRAFEEIRGRDVSNMTDMSDKRTNFEKNKINLYWEIKKHILQLRPLSSKIDAHSIAQKYQDTSANKFDAFAKGTPVSKALYLPDKNGKPALYIRGSVQEEFPEIRLRNIKDENNNIAEDVCVIRGIKLNTNQTLLSQVIDKIDFPEDYVKHFYALQVFEDDYNRARQTPYLSAIYRYFTENGGALVFESDQEKFEHNGNGGSYGGYFTLGKSPEDEQYLIVVIPSRYNYEYFAQHKYQPEHNDNWSNNERRIYHELFHAIDLSGSTHFSELPIFKYSIMLAEMDKNNKIKAPFDIVNQYPSSEYNMEMAAQIMGVAEENVLKDSPLLSKVHKLGQYFAMAKETGNKVALSCLSVAMSNSPVERELRIAYLRFEVAKKNNEKLNFIDDNRLDFLKNRIIKNLDDTALKMEKILKQTSLVNITQKQRY